MIREQNKAYIFALGAVLLWSTVSTAFKISLRYVTPLGLLFFSATTATLFLMAVCFATHGKSLFRTIKAEFPGVLPRGLLNPFLYYLILFVAYNRLPAQEAQVLNYTWAIVLSLLSVLILKERFRARDLTALGLSFVGVVIISTRGRMLSLSFADPLGSGLAVSTSVIWAAYWILNMKDTRPAELKLLSGFLAGTVATLIYVLLSGKMTAEALFASPDQALWGILGSIYVGIFEMGLTFILWQKALEKAVNTASVANLIFLTPFISLLFIAFILREAINPATLAGLVIIVGSNLWQKGKRGAPKPAEQA